MLMELHPEDQAYLCALLEDSIRNPQQIDTPSLDFVRNKSPRRRRAGFEANGIRFDLRKTELRKRYPEGTYVAMWRGVPVVVGDNSGEVADEFYEQYGQQVVYVGKLSDEPDVAEMVSPTL